MSESEKWKKINKSKEERPKVQEYKNWKELSPIPISLPIEGNMGTSGICAKECPTKNIEMVRESDIIDG